MKFFFSLILIFSSLFAKSITISHEKLNVEIADNENTRQNGLKKRSVLPYSSGMIFIYQKPQNVCFWMKNTLIDLSIGFFDENKVLFQIEKMPCKYPFNLYKSKKPIKYALEVNMGWFEDKKIKLGDSFSFN